MLRDPDSDIREQAAYALGETGEAQAVPALMSAYLHDAGTLVFSAALDAIVRIGGRSAVSSLVDILTDRSNYRNLRWPVAAALGQLQDESAFETLRKALKDEAEVIRRHAAEALGRMGNRGAVADLRTCLLDVESGVRAAAAGALGRLGDGEAIPTLLAALPDPHPMVREAAFRALLRLDREALAGALREAVRDRGTSWRRDAALFSAELLGNEAFPVLEVFSRDADSNVREGAAAGLGYLSGVAPGGCLLTLLDDSSLEVRRAAISALERVPHPDAISKLVIRLRRDDAELVRIDAAHALGELRAVAAIEALLEALDEGNTVSIYAAVALGHLRDDRAVAPLAALARRLSGTARLREWPISALVRIDSALAVQALRELWQRDNDEGRRRIMGRMNGMASAKAGIAFLAGLADTDPSVRLHAHEGLRGLSRAALEGALREGLIVREPAIRSEAANLLPFYADEEICRQLETLSRTDDNLKVIAAASEAAKNARRKLEVLSRAHDIG
jgi:HEAT repeat protein